MATELGDRIRRVGYGAHREDRGFREAVDEVMTLITKDDIPTTATLVLFGQACEQLKTRASQLDTALIKDLGEMFSISDEVDKALTATSDVRGNNHAES